MFKKVYSLYSAFYPSLRFTLSLQSAFYTQSAFYPWSAVCSLQSAVRSLRFTLTGFFKTLSIGPAPGIEPATSRSAVKRSTD